MTNLHEDVNRPTRSRSGSEYIRNLYRGRPPTRRRFFAVAAWFSIFAILLVADGLYAVNELRRSTRQSTEAFEAALDAFESGRLQRAHDLFVVAGREARTSEGVLAHPSVAIAGWLPWLDRDVEAARQLTRAAVLGSNAGTTAVRAAIRLGGTNAADLSQSFLVNGRVQLNTIANGASYLQDIHDIFLRADDALTHSPEPTIPVLQRTLDSARAQVGNALGITERAQALVGALPELLGGNGPRRYFLAFQSPSEARATGGIIGLYGVLEARNGRVVLTHVGPTAELFTSLDRSSISTIEEGEDLLRRYEDALERSASINLSPDFEAVSRALLRIYQAASGERLDGVLATDPITLQLLTRATGPLEVTEPPPIGPDNAVEVLLHDTYVEFADRPEEQNRFLNSVITEFYEALGGRSIDGPTLIESFGAAANSMHLRIYSADPELQAQLVELGLAGALPEPSPMQAVFHNNLGGNKIDYYLDREIDTSVRFRGDGSAEVTTRILLDNHVPDDAPAAMIRPNDPSLRPGDNAMELTLLMPPGSEVGQWRFENRPIPRTIGEQNGFVSASARVVVPRGTVQEVKVVYQVPGMTDPLTGGAAEFTLYPQPTIRPDAYRLTFVPPAGFQVTSSSGGRSLDHGALAFAGTLYQIRTFDVEISGSE